MLAPYSKIPVVPVTIGFMSGILLFGVGLPSYAAVAITVVAAALLYLRDRFYTFGLMAVGIGWLFTYLNTPAPLPGYLHDSRENIVGEVLRKQRRSGADRMLVRIDSLNHRPSPAPFKVWVTVPDGNEDVGVGSVIAATTHLRDVRRFDGLPFETDYGRFALVDGAVALASVHRNDLRILSDAGGFSESLRRRQESLIDAIYLSGLDNRAADFLVATVCGDSSYMPHEESELFRSLGLAHLLALSGFHVALFAWLVALLVFPLRLSRRFARSRHIFVIMAVWVYVAVTGLAPSAVRAATLLSIVLGGRLLQRASGSFNALAVAALLMLAFNPYLLYSPGFQLSFGAVLGLLVFAEPLNPFSRRRPWPHRLAALLCVPAAAVLGTAVMSMVYFHRFPLLFLPANIIATLIASPLIAAGMLLAIFGLFGVRLHFLAWLIDVGYDLLDAFCRAIAGIPGREITDLYPLTPVIILMILSLIALGIAVNRGKRLPAILSATALVLALSIQNLMAEPLPEGELYVLTERSDTRMILRQGNMAVLYSSRLAPVDRTLVGPCNSRYAHWLERHGCSGIQLLDSVQPGEAIRRTGNIIQAGPYTVALINHEADILPVKIDYAVIGQGSDIDFEHLKATMQPQQVILSANLHKKRRQTYIEACRSVELDFHNATDSIFRLQW